MAIYLVTGSPGGGKTLFVVKTIVEELVPTGRAVYTDIEGFEHGQVGTIPFESDDGSANGRNWEAVPDNSILVLDEVQRAFPPRNPASAVPSYIQAMETHRHRGIDLWIITQAPRLIDRHIWPLIERHYHLHRVWGLNRSTLMQWESVAENPSPSQTQDDAQKKNLIFPKKYYGLYKSATIHTAQPKLPLGRFAVVGGGILAAFGGFWYIKGNLLSSSPSHASTAPVSAPADPVFAGGPCAAAVGMVGDKLLYQFPDGGVLVSGWVAFGDEVRPGLVRCS